MKYSKTYHKVFSISDVILIVGYDADTSDHHKAMKWVMQICRQENLQLKK